MTSKKPAVKKSSSKKAGTEKASEKKSPASREKSTPTITSAADAAAERSKGETAAEELDASKKKTQRKGITIVSKRPKPKPRQPKPALKFPPTGDKLLGPDSPVRKPLIPSGPSARGNKETLASAKADGETKSPFTKRETDRYRKILLTKRAELLGDLEHLESEALMGQTGDLSHTPQHLAEQGSDSYDRTLSLDLAAADRRLIREIDDALKRIQEGRFGVCELTGKPIGAARLEELPWARYSIEAARALERGSMHP